MAGNGESGGSKQGVVFGVGHEKGGVGKTSFAVSLAVSLRTMGYTVAILDTDKQASSATWYEMRKQSPYGEDKGFTFQEGHSYLHTRISDLSQQVDVVIVDVGAGDYDVLVKLAITVDLWVAPVQVGYFDIKSTINLINAFRDADQKHIRGKIPLAIVFNKVPGPWNAMTEVRDAKATLVRDANGEFFMTEGLVRERRPWRDVSRSGYGIIEMQDEKATEEWDQIVNELIHFMQTSTA